MRSDPGAPAPGDAVTIVIPTYRQEPFIADCVASALAQRHPRLEVLVMDDASPDATPAVLDRFRGDPRLRVIRHPANLGRVANYRAGLAAARGDWILMLDGDDRLVDPEFVSAAVSRALAVPETVLVIAGQRWRAPQGVREGQPTTQAEEVLEGQEFFLRWVSPLQVVPHLGTLYRARPARELDFYRRDILSSDWESLRRLCLRGRVVLLGRVAGEWRGHADNASRDLDPQRHGENLDAIVAPYADAVALGFGGPRLERWRREALRRYVAVYLEAVLTRGDAGAVGRFREVLAARLGAPAARSLVLGCLATRPSLWTKLALRALGGERLLAWARRAWHLLTWSRG